MNDAAHSFGYLRNLVWQDLLIICAIVVASRVLIWAVRWTIRRIAETGPVGARLKYLGLAPISRVVIELGTVAIILPILIEPTFRNTIALLATVGVAVAFALKDYVSAIAAGFVTILERIYQPGDWIEVDGNYGEVKSVGVRAVHIVTADDTEIIIPHTRFWSDSVSNATSGNRSLLCVASFYLEADHDGIAVQRVLARIAESSTYRRPETQVTVVASEKPWGTHYRLKAYVKESREQFIFTTDLTLRAKTALREMNIRFAHAPYAVTERS